MLNKSHMDHTTFLQKDYQALGKISSCQFLFSSVQSLSRVWLLQPHESQHTRPPLSITSSRSSLRLTSIEFVMPSSHLILCHPLLPPSIFPSITVFSNEAVLHISIGVSASASVLPMNIQDWFSLGLTGWISLQFKGLSRVFSNITVQKHQFFSVQLSLYSDSHIHTWPQEKP